MDIAVIGLGPWGLAVLERLVSRLKRQPSMAPVTLHVFEPGEPGVGIHTPALPDYLLLNTKCGHVSMFVEKSFTDAADALEGPTLMDWAQAQGYQFGADGYGLTLAGDGRSFTADDFVPRRLLGEYLRAFYQTLLASLPSWIVVRHHQRPVTSIVPALRGGERVIVEGGAAFEVSAVFLTTGHTPNAADDLPDAGGRLRVRYPMAEGFAGIPAGAQVGISGFGLVGIDALTTLTIGRGGRYIPNADGRGRRYVASGAEPTIYLYSRTGLPYCSRPAISKSVADYGYEPQIFTPKAVDALRAAKGGDGKLDFVADVLPLIWAEMTLAYYETLARETVSPARAQALRSAFMAARGGPDEDALRAALSAEFGPFDPDHDFFQPLPARFRDAEDYLRGVQWLLRADLVESYLGEIRSPVKSAYELFRVLRENIRYVVDYHGLTAESQRYFKQKLAPSINRIIVGPPKERSEELLALIEAGIVRVPFGPSPQVEWDAASGKTTVSSTVLDAPYSAQLDVVIEGHLSHPSVHRSTAPLLANLYQQGRITPYAIDGVAYDGITLDRAMHPINRDGHSEATIYVLGPLTEGIKYFNHYIPSPTSRLRAFKDADACVQALLATTLAAAA